MYDTIMSNWRAEKRKLVYILGALLSISMIFGMYYSETRAEQLFYSLVNDSFDQCFSGSTPVIEDALRLDSEVVRFARPLIQQNIVERGVRSNTRAELVLIVLFLLAIFCNYCRTTSSFIELTDKRTSYFIIRYIHAKDGRK